MTDPQRDSEQPRNVLGYAGPGVGRAQGLSLGAASIACAVLGTLGIPIVFAAQHEFGVILYVVGVLGAGLAGLCGLASGRPGRGKAAVGLLLGLVMLTVLVALVPLSMSASSERANRVKCASNLRQIGQGIMLYANDNKGQCPRELGALVAGTDLISAVFVCPSGNADQSTGATTQQVLADLRTSKYCSYTYYGAGRTWPADPSVILASEGLQDHDKDGINVLFGDGHVEWINAKTAVKVLAELAAGQNPPPSLPWQPANGRSP